MYTEKRVKSQIDRSVNETVQTENISLNRQLYQRLKLALSLGLRRQILFAICDDLNLRNRIAARLHSTLAYPVGQILYQRANAGELSTPAYPRLVTLRLNVSDPNPIAQINQWLVNYPPPLVGGSPDHPGRPLPIPGFQIVGVEMLTKEPVAVQRLFLNYLHLSEQHLFAKESSRFLESSLLFWVSRPWLSAIQQSAPQFWHCRTGVFVFAGEPTPTIDNRDYGEVFGDSRNLERQNFESFTFDHQEIFQEVKQQTPVDLTTSIQEDLLNETPAKSPTVSPISHKQSFPSLSHINQELKSLINATLSIDHSGKTQEILAEIEELHIQEARGEDLAIAYQNLGNLYRLQIEQGDVTLENLMIAILAYQEAVSHDENSPQLPDILNDLGTLYWMLHRIPDSAEEAKIYIQQAIDFYKLALKLITGDSQPETYARIQNNLGTAYGDLSKFAEPVENWQAAVIAYQEALHYRQEEIEPLKYAACQNNLGTAYWHLGQYNQPVENLQKAITAYKLASIHYQPVDEPLKYGMIQNNIGTAYWNLSQYEKPMENLQLAIQVYNEALKYRRPKNVPHGYAATQNNLGIAYWHLANQSQTIKEDKQQLVQFCIHAYEEALKTAHSFSNLPLSFDIWLTHNNLGLAYYYSVTNVAFNCDKKMLSQALESALENHLQALTGFAKETENYQTTISHIINTIRTFHNELGIQGQNLALSKLPGQLLPNILPKL
ncbi:MAG: tetratricopeptide repeat protein [Cuspidothrix sp.]